MASLSQISHPDSSMGPEHSAIVLSQPTPDISASVPTMMVDIPAGTAQESAPSQYSAARTMDTIRQRFTELTGDGATGSSAPTSLGAVPRSHVSEMPRPLPAFMFTPRSETFPSQASSTRRSLLASHMFHRRDSNPADPSTSLGRRVEARAAAARHRTNRGNEDATTRIRDLASNIDRVVSRFNQQREEVFAAPSSSRTTNSSHTTRSSGRSVVSPRGGTLSRDAGRHRQASARPVNWGRPARVSLPSQDPEEPEWILPFAEDIPQVLPASMSTTSLAYTVSVPSTMPLPLPNAPSSNTSAPRRNFGMPDLESDSDETLPPPGFRVRRRVDAWGVERIHHVMIDSSDEEEEPYSFSISNRRPRPPLVGLNSARVRSDMLGRMRAAEGTQDESGTGMPAPSEQLPLPRDLPSLTGYERLQERFEMAFSGINPSISSSYGITSRPRRRSRGWGAFHLTCYSSTWLTFSSLARLDQDGNEIPTDEEEEYERNRAHMRNRAQALSSGNSFETVSSDATTLPPPPPDYMSYTTWMAPATQSRVPISSEDPGYALVRLNGRARSRSYTPTVIQGDFSDRSRSRSRTRRRTEPLEGSGTSGDFHPSPLPWASVDLTPGTSSRTTEKEKRIYTRRRLSTRSPFAGR
ncbi:hypothetical protein PHLCEN_2v1039 [Hermanssonia centrifuga]|uniref:Uncharacterized protein n=1 Tax=Hermanssonia centrifuga TaxID=98765 RepID=A0A2R6S4G8_9APHY|nr:hypothetical protein PHLCEN_2v1039 [Hermanssonia centrifuga]